MNIKDQQTHDLARQVATLMGVSLKDAVAVSLQEKLERLIPEQAGEQERRRAQVGRIVAEMRALAAGMPTLAEINESLYDPETGLPA